MFVFREEQILKLKKLLKELEAIRGRHTELVSVYIPSGYSIIEVINQLSNEKSTAMNIKSKNTRKNVLSALEKIIQHLRIFKQTPPNGLVVFCGNISPVEGREDLKIWSFEPPEKMDTKVYWCDQVFVLDPLREIVKEKEIYGLVVMDAKEAEIGLLMGKKIKSLKHLDSNVPSKTVKGGMCVSEDTLMQLEDGNIIPVKDLCKGKKILSYSFKNFRPVFSNSFEIFKRKSDRSYELKFKEPSNSLVVTPEHLVFVVEKNGIEEKSVDEIKAGDMLLSVSNLEMNERDNKEIDQDLSQLIGYMLGDGTIDNNRIIIYDKDIQLLNVYKNFAEKFIEKTAVIRKKRNSYELRLYKKSFVDFVKSNFPGVSRKRSGKYIDTNILCLPKVKLKHFIRGLFDAEGYVDRNSGIGLRMTNENIVKKLQLILTRFKIVSSVRGPDKFNRYELRITNSIYIKSFKDEIGFSSLKKSKKLDSIIKDYKSGMSTRVPISGIFLRKLIEENGLKKEDFKKYGMFLTGRRNIGYPPFERMIKELKSRIKNKDTLDLLEKIYSSGLVTVTVKEKKEIKSDKEFYDLHVPGFNSFVANGIVIHNSQARYDRLREDAVNEFLTEVGEIASKSFLDQPELKGVIIGGPGPVKEQFAREDYLNYQIKNKIIGVKNIGYTDYYGLEELVKKSEDLLAKAAVMKEQELMERFLTEIKKEGNVVYGYTETIKALNMNAIDTLLISEEFDWVRVKLKCDTGHEVERDLPKSEVKTQLCEICKKEMRIETKDDLGELLAEKSINFGTKVELISIDTTEGRQFKELGGIGGFLRYKID